jgi:hypothetical protein
MAVRPIIGKNLQTGQHAAEWQGLFNQKIQKHFRCPGKDALGKRDKNHL